MIPALILADVFYIATFDHMPNAVRLALAGIIGVGYFSAALVAITTRITSGLGLMFVGTFLILLAWGLGPLVDPFEPMRGLSTWDAGIRFVIVFPAGIAILAYADQIPHEKLATAIGLTLLIATFAALTNPWASLGDGPEMRLAPFTGTPVAEVGTAAPEGLHSSAYVVSLFFLILLAMRQRKLIPEWKSLMLLGGCAVFIIGYQVRTAWILLLAFAVTAGVAWVARRGRDGTLMALSSTTALIAAAFMFLAVIACVDLGIDILEFSSGRTGTYGERIDFISERTLPAQLLGSGPGSDFMYSRVWWWVPKDSHNDFLRTIIEGGLVALLGTILYLVGIVLHTGRRSIPYVMAIVATSAISNALLGRTMLIPLMYVAIAIATQPAMRAAARAAVASRRIRLPRYARPAAEGMRGA